MSRSKNFTHPVLLGREERNCLAPLGKVKRHNPPPPPHADLADLQGIEERRIKKINRIKN